jgi:hypothetical protein
MKNIHTMRILISIVLIVIAVIGGFFLGMTYQKSQINFGMIGQGSRQDGNFRMLGQGGANTQNSNFRPVRGQVVSADNNNLTVKMSDGSTKLVVLSESTAFMQSTKASLSDIKTGDTVNVLGTQNSDGSITAQDVQINPPQGGFMMRSGSNQTAPSQPAQ